MDAKVERPVIDKSDLPSRYTTVGTARAPHRSCLYMTGFSREEIAQPPAGGITRLVKTFFDNGCLHGDCMTVTGRTLAENMDKVGWNERHDAICPAGKPITNTGVVMGFKGKLAPDGAIVKVAGMKNHKFTGSARCFDSEEACFEAVEKTVDVDPSDEEMQLRRKDWKPRKMGHQSGAIWKYAQSAGSARYSAVTRPGAEKETHCYADI
jgi:dihydroxyacid dehydratase/phosphogluconate dehydratase